MKLIHSHLLSLSVASLFSAGLFAFGDAGDGTPVRSENRAAGPVLASAAVSSGCASSLPPAPRSQQVAYATQARPAGTGRTLN